MLSTGWRVGYHRYLLVMGMQLTRRTQYEFTTKSNQPLTEWALQPLQNLSGETTLTLTLRNWKRSWTRSRRPGRLRNFLLRTRALGGWRNYIGLRMKSLSRRIRGIFPRVWMMHDTYVTIDKKLPCYSTWERWEDDAGKTLRCDNRRSTISGKEDETNDSQTKRRANLYGTERR